VVFLFLIHVKATLMPRKTSHQTDPPPYCQLIDLLKEKRRFEERKFSLPMNGEVSKRIHDRISFQKWQNRFEVLQIVSPTPEMGNLAYRDMHCQHGFSADHAKMLLGRTIQ